MGILVISAGVSDLTTGLSLLRDGPEVLQDALLMSMAGPWLWLLRQPSA